MVSLATQLWHNLLGVKGFYRQVVSELVAEGTLRKTAKVLVVCGSETDHAVFHEAGFENVTITNLDDRLAADWFAPFKWSFQDAEALGYDDSEFDVVVVHAGLHHCRSPHRALLEMYRVAKEAVLVIEARDSWAMRRATSLGVALDYEVSAVAAGNWTTGGVGNGPIPNYVYRWTEREVEKTLASCNPEGRQMCRFFYGLEIPFEYVQVSPAKLRLLRALALPLRALTWALPSQGNCFGFWVSKPKYPEDLQPWLTVADGEILPKGHPRTKSAGF